MDLQEADVECASWLADSQVPFSLVFTKTDKRKKGVPAPQQNIDSFQVRLLVQLNIAYVFSVAGHCPLQSCASNFQ